MSPTELKCHGSQTVEFPIRSLEIARNRPDVVHAEKILQYDAPPRRIDVEQRVLSRPEAPCPTLLSVFLAAGFVDVKMRLARQPLKQFAVEVPQSRVRHVPASLEVRCQGRIPEIQQLRSEESGFFDFRRQHGGVKTLTMFAPIPRLAKFRNDEGLVGELDLLMDFGRLGREDELAAAGRTGVEFEIDEVVDLGFVEGFSKVLLVSLLGSAFPFPLVLRLDGRFDAIGGVRLGGVGRIFPEHSDFGFEFGDASLKLFDESRLLQGEFLPIHTPCFTPFSSFHQHQFTRFAAQTP